MRNFTHKKINVFKKSLDLIKAKKLKFLIKK